MTTTSSIESSVFVGNLPNDATEEKLAEAFSAAGQVVRFRIMTDPATGSRKGFGFCDFTTPEAAQNALKNLNGLKFMGRDLRVSEAAPPGSGQGGSGGHYNMQTHRQARDIDTALRELSVGEVYDILVETKKWIQADPDKARDVLTQRPVLAQALLKMQSQLGMLQTAPPSELSFAALASSAGGMPTTTSVMMGGGMVPGSTSGAPGASGVPGGSGYLGAGMPMVGMMIPPPGQPPQFSPLPSGQYFLPPPPASGIGGSAPYQSGLPGGAPPMPVPFAPPPFIYPPSAPLPQPQQPQSQPHIPNMNAIQQQQAQLAMQQQQILSQIYALSDAQIAVLPPDERARVMRIKETGRLM